MKIVNSVKKIAEIVSEHKKRKKKVGLVVGAFDVLHMGHINLFRLAKKHVDILIIGLDHDKTLTIIKGPTRPINNYKRRSQFLSEIDLVDYVFKVNKIFKHGSDESTDYFLKLYRRISPTHVFTHVKTDSQESKRKDIAKSLNIKFVPDTSKTVTHSSTIIVKLESEL